MLQYRRRNEIDVLIASYVEESPTALLTYCNWSYAPYYLRIFNEAPRKVVEAFLEQYEISKSSLDSIYNNLLDNGFKVKNVNL